MYTYTRSLIQMWGIGTNMTCMRYEINAWRRVGSNQSVKCWLIVCALMKTPDRLYLAKNRNLSLIMDNGHMWPCGNSALGASKWLADMVIYLQYWAKIGDCSWGKTVHPKGMKDWMNGSPFDWTCSSITSESVQAMRLIHCSIHLGCTAGQGRTGQDRADPKGEIDSSRLD